jgi:hypothetical protein
MQPGWVRFLLHNPPQGLTALSPPKRGFHRDFLNYITLRQAVWVLLSNDLGLPACCCVARVEQGPYTRHIQLIA